MEELEGGRINPHWAHDNQLRAAYLLEELEKHSETRDLSAVESELTAVLTNLNKLIEALDCIHRPFSTDQHDPDHSFTEEQWAELKAIGGKAERDTAGIANELLTASS